MRTVSKKNIRQILAFALFSISMVGCGSFQTAKNSTSEARVPAGTGDIDSSTQGTRSEVEKFGKEAIAAVHAIASAKIPSNDGSDDAVVYHIWDLDCAYSMIEGRVSQATCLASLGPSGKAPQVPAIRGSKAIAIVNALHGVGAASLPDQNNSTMFHIHLLNVDATSATNVESNSIKFVDMNSAATQSR